MYSNGEHWYNNKNAVNIASGLVIYISCLQSMGFENIYEIEISESMINPGCHVKLLTGILWEKWAKKRCEKVLNFAENYTWFAWGGTNNILNDTSSNLMSTLLRSLWKRQQYIWGIELLQWFKILWRKYSTKSSKYDMVIIKKKICV